MYTWSLQGYCKSRTLILYAHDHTYSRIRDAKKDARKFKKDGDYDVPCCYAVRIMYLESDRPLGGNVGDWPYALIVVAGDGDLCWGHYEQIETVWQ
jgi:hypothetical protein